MPRQHARAGPRVQTFRDFYADVTEQLPALLPRDLRDFRTARTGSVFKVFYDDHHQHFELWFHGAGLEVAFHLEGGAEDGEIAKLLERKLANIRRQLGGDVRLEPFGKGWTHLFELWRGVSRGPDLAAEAAERLAEYVRVVEPLRRA
jgi:hypothetical protein